MWGWGDGVNSREGTGEEVRATRSFSCLITSSYNDISPHHAIGLRMKRGLPHIRQEVTGHISGGALNRSVQTE